MANRLWMGLNCGQSKVARGPHLLAAILLGATLLSGCSSPCKHFKYEEVSPGIFIGCRPHHPTDFTELRRRGIRTLLSFETLNWHIGPERRQATRNGIAFLNVPIFASPFGPTERSMKQALLTLDNRDLRPIYIHCLYGRDRTAVIFALYRVYYDGWSPQAAWEESLARGFKADWSLWGFRTYFWHHTQPPAWVHSQAPNREARADENHGGLPHSNALTRQP